MQTAPDAEHSSGNGLAPAVPLAAARGFARHCDISGWFQSDPQRWLHRMSVLLLAAWCLWWGASLARQDLVGARWGWFPKCFGVDFIYHVDKPTRIWLAGGDPYEDKARKCSYPPMTMRLFAWVGLMNPTQALTLWICATGLIAVGGGVAAWRSRRRLHLSSLPLSTILVVILYSLPMVFSMERGQYDLVTIPIVLGALAIMRRETRWSQVAAGALLAIAPWAKVYPGLLGVGLAGLRRWDALASFAVVGLAIGVGLTGDTERWLVNNELHMEEARKISRLEHPTHVCPWNHSLTDNWPRIWNRTPLRPLSRINGYVAAAAILGPLLFWVSRRISQCRERQQLAFPYLMWVVALAAFVPPVANDYSLVVLPVAILAACGPRDPVLCRLAILALGVAWQPFGLPITGRLLILVKLAALFSVGVSLVRRAREVDAAADSTAGRLVVVSPEPVRLAA